MTGQERRRSGRWTLLGVVAVVAVVGVLVLVGLVAAMSGPVGQQRDTDELGGDYCAYFPEDC